MHDVFMIAQLVAPCCVEFVLAGCPVERLRLAPVERWWKSFHLEVTIMNQQNQQGGQGGQQQGGGRQGQDQDRQDQQRQNPGQGGQQGGQQQDRDRQDQNR